MKVLMVIVSGGEDPVYQEHKKVLRLNSHPQVTSVFIEYSTNVSEITLEGDTLLLPGVESYEAMTRKTIDSYEYLLKDESFTHVIRTNLSSWWHYPRMLERLKTLPTQGLFGGILGETFVSGAGMHMSRDVALLLVSIKERAYETNAQDDLAISDALKHAGVALTLIPGRIDLITSDLFNRHKHQIPTMCYHVRLKQLSNRSTEPEFMRELLDIFRQS